jgi:hypothetical protein
LQAAGKPLPFDPMRISPAGLRSGLPTTTFVAVPSSRRESHLGLRRRLAPQISAYPTAHGQVPLLSALRASTGRAEPAALEPVAPGARSALRRGHAITWSRPASGTASRPRLRSATPWRG